MKVINWCSSYPYARFHGDRMLFHCVDLFRVISCVDLIASVDSIQVMFCREVLPNAIVSCSLVSLGLVHFDPRFETTNDLPK